MDLSPLDRIKILLQTRGMTTASALMQELGVSRPTFSRLIHSLAQQVIRIGSTNQSRYALLKEIPGLGSDLPTFRVNETGKLTPEFRLSVCFQQTYILNPSGQVFTGYPPEVADLIPQGFMGRAFAKRYALELGVSDRPQDWSEDAIWTILAKRGEDLPGNLVIGEESAGRFQRIQYSEVSQAAYPEMARASLLGQTSGSSAGGEQPKFTAFRKGHHRLVKFAGMDLTPAQVRTRDLLICEFHALKILEQHGIETAKTELIEDGNWVFLDSKRFDRIAEKGRKAVVTLAALDDFHFGKRDHWSASAERFLKADLMNENDVKNIKLLDAYGLWIGNSDRHFHNLSFWIENAKESKNPYRLAPAFDQLPMLYMPIAGRVLARKFELPIPSGAMIEVWTEARALGLLFWESVKADQRISANFRKIAAQNLALVRSET